MSVTRLLLVSTNYAPEQAGIGPYATQIAEHWAHTGRGEVHVLAGMPHYPQWETAPEYRGRWRLTEDRAGVSVHRRRHTVPRRQSALKRALYEASVLGHGLIAGPRMGAPDLVTAQLPSLAGGVLGARLAKRYGVPYVPVVQDLMGAAAAQSGIRGGDRAAKGAAAVEAWVLGRATLVGVIHESFVERVAAMGVPESRIRLVPNWSHVARPVCPRAGTRERLGWPEDQTVVLHSGNMGLKQGLEVLVETARLAPEVRIVLMGDGNQRELLQEAGRDLPNLDFLPPADDADFTDVLAAADVLAVTQRATVKDMSVPSKLTSYFATGRPVVASIADEGGTAEEMRRAGAGVIVPPEDPEALLAAVRELAADPGRADGLGARGPAYVEAHLGRGAGLARIEALLDEAMGMAEGMSEGTAEGPGAGKAFVPRPRSVPEGVVHTGGTNGADAGERTGTGEAEGAH
ncbi:glycosyltransferase [Streptomyces polyrhachis]|uniref:Glycosyltransferase n=1 Tax=Streptomyces polyrhachis TaxID=1282885 RepID=A0ABW2GMA3_9ACTN